MSTDAARPRAVGQSLKRLEDVPLLRGEGMFCGDLALPGMLDVAFARSYLAHATVSSVDTAAALSLDGVRAVITAADVNGIALTPPLSPPGGDVYSTPRPLLAFDRVRYVGEPIAAVVADSRYLAEDGAGLVMTDLEPLPVLETVADARAADSILLHPTESNVLFEHAFDSGGVDAAFAAAEIVVEREFVVPRLSPAPLEPRGIVAVLEDDVLRVWYSTQTPYVLRRVLADLLELDLDSVRVTCPHVGGGFGMKSHVYPEDVLVPLLALRLGQPVRWLEDRQENLVASCHARGQTLKARLAARADGVILAVDFDTSVDVGAYGIYPHGQLLEALGTPIMITGPYRTPQLRFTARAVATNKCPGGGYRGVGLAASVFVHERLIDILARTLSLEPAEVRRRNLFTPDELPAPNPIGLVYDSGDYPGALAAALNEIGYSEIETLRADAASRGRRLGFGLCSYTEYTGMGSNVFQDRGMVAIDGHEEARVSIEADGTALVRVSVPATGQGSESAYRQIVADALALDVTQVALAPVDTASGADGSGSFGSRGTVVGGGAVVRSGETLRGRLLELASRYLEVATSDLELVDGSVAVRGAPAIRVDYAELAAIASDGELDVVERNDPTDTVFSYGVHAVMVEVDPELGTVEIIRYVVVDDCGTVINPLIVEGQAHGSTAQGIGAALLEEAAFAEDAQPVAANFADYLVPTATDLPTFTVLHLEHPSPFAIGGFKGVGEGGTVAAPAAVTNAVADAIGAEINAIPAKPELVFSLLVAGESA